MEGRNGRRIGHWAHTVRWICSLNSEVCEAVRLPSQIFVGRLPQAIARR